MTNYAVLVYEDLTTTMKTVVTIWEGSHFFEQKQKEVDALEKDPNFKLVGVVATTDKAVYSRAVVKAKLEELISYTEHYKDYFDNTVFVNDEVRKQAFSSYLDYEKVLIRKVSLAVEMCMCEGVEVESELALACYDYRHREIAEHMKKSEELKQAIM